MLNWQVAVTLAFAGLMGLAFVVAVGVGAQLQPYADQLAYNSTAYEFFDHHLSLPEYLWLPHVGHHIVWVRILTLLDMRLLGGTLWPQILTGLLALLGLAAVLGREASLAAADKGMRLQGWVAGALLILTGYNAGDAAQTGNIVYPFAAVFAAGAVVLWVRADDPVRSERTSLVLRGLALISAMLAALGNAAGLAVWPALVVCSLTSPTDIKHRAIWTLIVLASGVAFVALYFAGGSGPGQLHDNTQATGVSVFNRVRYFLTFLGAPWSRISAAVGAFVGLAVLGISIEIARRTRWSSISQPERIGFALLVLVITAGVLAAAARADLGLDRAPQRYGIFASILQVAILLVLLTRGDPVRLRGRSWLLPAAMVLFGLFQVAGAGELRSAARKADARVTAFRSGDRSGVVSSFVYPDADFAADLYRRFDHDGLYKIRHPRN